MAQAGPNVPRYKGWGGYSAPRHIANRDTDVPVGMLLARPGNAVRHPAIRVTHCVIPPTLPFGGSTVAQAGPSGPFNGSLVYGFATVPPVGPLSVNF